jgi:hypothetical protein
MYEETKPPVEKPGPEPPPAPIPTPPPIPHPRSMSPSTRVTSPKPIRTPTRPGPEDDTAVNQKDIAVAVAPEGKQCLNKTRHPSLKQS